MTDQKKIETLNVYEIDAVNGGFVCGGLCIVGIAFGAGLIFGAGMGLGYAAESKTFQAN